MKYIISIICIVFILITIIYLFSQINALRRKINRTLLLINIMSDDETILKEGARLLITTLINDDAEAEIFDYIEKINELSKKDKNC